MLFRSTLFVCLGAAVVACSSTGADDGATANESHLTEVGAGVEVARCWFDTVAPSIVNANGFATLKCSVTATDGTVLTPSVLQLAAQHPDALLHQPVTDTLQVLPAQAPAFGQQDGIVLQSSEFPLDARIAALINLPTSEGAKPPVVQALDGRGAFYQTLHVASFEEAAARGAANPFVIQMPLTTWEVRVALPTATPVTLSVDPYRASIAPWLAADPANRDTLAVKAVATGSSRCLVASILAPMDAAPLSAVVTGLDSDLRGTISAAGDYVADIDGGFRLATADEASNGPCAAGTVGAACNAGACNSGLCIGGLCQDACGAGGQACCGDSSTSFGDRCGANAFCKTATSQCVTCGVEGTVCCPNTNGEATTCSDGLRCNAFSACEAL